MTSVEGYLEGAAVHSYEEHSSWSARERWTTSRLCVRRSSTSSAAGGRPGSRLDDGGMGTRAIQPRLPGMLLGNTVHTQAFFFDVRTGVATLGEPAPVVILSP